MDEAAARGRLNGMRRLWLVESVRATSTGTYGIRALESRGFVKSAKFTSHRSVIYEFTRQHTSARDFRTFGRSLRGTPRNRR